MPHVRLARPADAEAVADIYAPFVRDSAVSFELQPPDGAEMRGRIARTLDAFPWLVAEYDGAVTAYAYASRHQERAAYQWTANVSVYVSPAWHRRGLGRALYAPLLALLRAQGYRRAYAGITLPNAASVGVHEAFGFTPVGVYRKVGFKLGAWHDVGWWQLSLGGDDAPDGPPTPLARLVDAGLADEVLGGRP